MERTIDVTELEARIRAAGIRALLPAQVARSFVVDGAPAVLDVLPLAVGSIAIVRCAEQILAIPLADDAAPRRARPGDGVSAALARAIGDGATVGRFAASR